AEVVWLARDLPRFIGDMPHTWGGAGYVPATRTMLPPARGWGEGLGGGARGCVRATPTRLAYERESDEALVGGAGVKPEWVTSEPGLAVRRLPTNWGILNFSMRSDGPDGVGVGPSGDLTIPPGKMRLASPPD